MSEVRVSVTRLTVMMKAMRGCGGDSNDGKKDDNKSEVRTALRVKQKVNKNTWKHKTLSHL